MTAIDGAPYGQTETGAACTQAAALLNDEFDTSGTPIGFCVHCEHAPCVAGGSTWCAMSPHSSGVWRMEREIAAAVDYAEPHALLLLGLLDTVAFAASSSIRSAKSEGAQS